MKNFKRILFSPVLIILFQSCEKSDFLSSKPNSNIIIPSTLPELRALLDNTNIFTITPALGELAADNYYMIFSSWQSININYVHNNYTWEKDLFGGTGNIADWKVPYQQVLYSNIVLEQLSRIEITPSNSTEWHDIKGQALFLRAYAFYNLVQHFSAPYDNVTAATDLGIPIRLTADVNTIAQRATIKETYDQILADLEASKDLVFPNLPATLRNRSSKPAVFALLSRIHLSMRNYEKSGKYADSCLALYRTLINYNNSSISLTATTPFTRTNDETLYSSSCVSFTQNSAVSTTSFIDTLLYQSYSSNDLRKLIYFRTISGTNMGIKGGYHGTVIPFSGLAVDEVYLNRAECFARAGNTTAAMNDLDTLLIKRWKTGTFTPLSASSAADALNKVLTERRKELVWRGLRWIDLRRLNKDGANITLLRLLNGQTYTLPPNSPLYVFPIPDDEIALSGITQNPRQ